MASTTFSGPVTSTAGFIGDIKVPGYSVANAPSAATAGAGTLVYVFDGAGGDSVLAYSNGANWQRCDTRQTISAT